MTMETTNDLFHHELKDIYFAVHELTTVYDRMANETVDDDIRVFFEGHLSETSTHIERLFDVFNATGRPPETVRCQGIEGLLEEWTEFTDKAPAGPLHDYYNLTTAIKTERYELSAYRSLINIASRQDHSEAADLLQANLDENEQALDELIKMAQEFESLP